MNAMHAADGARAGPMIVGVDCKNGHFNDPKARYCGTCGIGMAQFALRPMPRPRPPLGVLMLPEGVVLRLDGDYLIGRDPDQAPEVASGAARPVWLTDEESSVSRWHLLVSLDGWDVRLIDHGSAGGTFVQLPGDPEFRRLEPNQPTIILPGTMVRIGSTRTFRYESHRS